MGERWRWEDAVGSIGDLVAATVPEPAARLVRVVEPTETAFVMGSTQCRPDGPTPHPTVRRRSGGGGVLFVPGQIVWVDLIVPRDDPWWSDDVGHAAHPVGAAWVDALRALDVHGDAHLGPMVTSPWSATLCFAGLGPGEVVADGRKIVGIAQRRTRSGACFQCAVPLVAPGRPSVEAAGLDGRAADEAVAALERGAGAVDRPATVLLGALRTALGAA